MADTHQNPKSAEKPRGTATVANILAIIGSIILIVIIVWGLVHLLSISGGFFSSLFGGKSDKMQVTAPATITSGQPAHISWKHSTKEPGMYAVMYPCTEGLRFSTRGIDDAFVTVPCGAAFAVGSATTSATVLPMLAGTTSVKTPFSVLFIPSSTSSKPVEGTVSMTVKPLGSPASAPVATPPTPKPTGNSQPPKPTQTPVSRGPADLAVTITSVSIDQWGNGTVTFNISNIGGSASGNYYFTAQLPTTQPYTYISPNQTSLSAGSYIVNTLRFTQAMPGPISIVVDPANTAPEYNEGNNTAYQYVSGSYPYNYQYPRY